MPRIYGEVYARIAVDGSVTPLSLVWEDHTYEIEKVLDMRPAYRAKVQCEADEYTILIGGKRSKLYFERLPEASRALGRWFVEKE